MQRNSLKFDPAIAQLAKPSGENWGTALGQGLKEIGATVNMAHDRSRKEKFEDSAESRAAEKHGWAGQKHAQSMTKGQLDIDYKKQANPLLVRGLELGNERSEQVIGQSSQTHVASMRDKGWDISGQGGCAGGSCGSVVGSYFDSDTQAPQTTIEPTTVEASSPQTAVEPRNGWGMTYIGKPKTLTKEEKLFEAVQNNPKLGSWLEGRKKSPSVKLTTSQKDYERAKEDPNGYGKIYRIKNNLDENWNPQTTTSRKYMTKANRAYHELLDNLPDEEAKAKFKKENPYQSFMEKYNQPKNNSLQKKIETSNRQIEKFQKSLPQEMQELDLAEIDMSKLTTAQRSKAESLANYIIAAENPKGATKAINKMGESQKALNQLDRAARITIGYMNNGKDFNMLDKGIRDIWSTKFGLSEDEMQTAFRDKAFQSAMNTVRHGLFGSAVSKGESGNWTDQATTLFRTNKDMALAMKNMVLDVKSDLDYTKRVIGSKAFNVKFGVQARNAEKLLQSLNQSIGGEEVQTEPKKQSLYKKPNNKKTVVKRGTHNGKKVVQYSDGSIEYVQ